MAKSSIPSGRAQQVAMWLTWDAAYQHHQWLMCSSQQGTYWHLCMMTPSLSATLSQCMVLVQDSGQAMVKLSCVTDNTCGSVYNALQRVSDRLRGSSIALVNMGSRVDECGRWLSQVIVGHIRSDATNVYHVMHCTHNANWSLTHELLCVYSHEWQHCASVLVEFFDVSMQCRSARSQQRVFNASGRDIVGSARH